MVTFVKCCVISAFPTFPAILGYRPGPNKCSLFTSMIYRPKIKCKEEGWYFNKNKKMQTDGNRKFFFSCFISEIPNFSCMGFLGKCSMSCRRIFLILNNTSWKQYLLVLTNLEWYKESGRLHEMSFKKDFIFQK